MIRKGDIKLLVLLLFICHGTVVLSQNLTSSYLDSLGYEELLTEFNSHEGDSISQEAIARAYLERARADKDSIKMARGYDRLARIYNYKESLKYADSIIYISRTSGHKTYPTLGYIMKGSIHHNRKEFKKATDYFIQAEYWATINSNDYLKLFIKKVLVGIKSIWGVPSEALKYSQEYLELLESVDYNSLYKNYLRAGINFDPKEAEYQYRVDYLEAIDLVTIAYIFNDQYDLAKINVEKSLSLVKNFDMDDKYHFYLSRSGEVEYYLGNYRESIDSLKKALPHKSKSSSLFNSYFYLGHSLIETGAKDDGIDFLRKADSIYDSTKEILPSHVKLFYTLYDYAKENENYKDQLSYLNKITKSDSLFKENYKYINSRIIEGYDIPLLIQEKELLIKRLTEKNKFTVGINILVISLFILSLMSLIYFIRRKRIYQIRFDELIMKQKSTESGIKQYSNEISDKVLQTIYSKLEEFETKNNFLDSEISLHSLSKNFNTNPNYLSRVINLRMEKNFSQYINDLRIEYAMNNLLNDPKLRKYTIKAIAEECGYKNSESFSKAFYKRNGIYPSYYIKQLEKSQGSVNRDN